jgi:dihydrofolate reductase
LVPTHHVRAYPAVQNGTTFHFVGANPREALYLATRAAGGLDAAVARGPATIGQFLAAGLVHEMHIAVPPGSAVRLVANTPWAVAHGVVEVWPLVLPGEPR